MKLLVSVILAAFYGLAIRLLIDVLDGPLSILSLSFFVLVPYFMGYLTIILLRYKESHSATGAFFKAILPCVVVLIVTICCKIEGAICWVMAFPFFALCSGLGGVVAFNRKKRRHIIISTDWDFDKDEWDKPGSLKFSFLLLIPVIAGSIEGDSVSSFQDLTVEQHVDVNAPPAAVWEALMTNSKTDVKSHGFSFSGMLGFPHHVSTMLNSPCAGGTRIARYEKGLVFTETIKKFYPERLMTLEITTDPSTISKAVMDEHIVIGGKHIKMQEDEYRLEALPRGRTRLFLSSRFSIKTPFNWYAGLWARLLMSDVLGEELYNLKNILYFSGHATIQGRRSRF